ncbi:MAG: hypothetical protein M1836_006010 [Candelina mexicana]|nr:MAG: hypothetical protein M1836_006010 [Candelina mexicana]
MLCPFPESTQLNNQLQTIKADTATSYTLIRTDNPESDSLPGQPRLRLHSRTLLQDLEKEFLTPDLDKLAPYLWLIATQSSQHIGPLHEQVLKGRQIVITENPELHLVWTDGRIFIKPIPRYMLSHAFWTTHLTTPRTRSCCASPETQHEQQPPNALLRAALGYMRSYYHLIQYESDLHIAKENRLLPPRLDSDDNNNVTIESFHAFISNFADIPDEEVSPRYSSSGTLRLSRLNLWTKVFLHRFQFFQLHRQYSEYFARFYAPILFVFGVLTVALGAMQVGLQASSNNNNNDNSDVGGGGSERDRWVGLQWGIGVCVAGSFKTEEEEE